MKDNLMGLDPKTLNLIRGKNFASFATILPDGFPHVTPVWIDCDTSDNILINTARGRVKEKNVLLNNKVALSIYNANNPYEMVLIKGNVIGIIPDESNHHFNSLSKKYLNLHEYPLKNPNHKRIILKIQPIKFTYLSYPLSQYL